MKRYKTVLILLGVLIVACVATVIVKHTEEKKEQIKNTDEVIISVAPDAVTSLAWEYGETSLAFSRTDVWHWNEDEAFPVDEEKLNDLLGTFENFGAAFIIEDVEDFGQYGLDDPTCTIRFTAEEKDYEVVLGAFSTMDAQRYVSIGDGNVYLVKKDPFDSYEIELSDTILHDDTPSFDKLAKITFAGTENYTITYEEDSTATYCASDLYFTQRGGKTVPLDTYRVEDYCGDISLLNLKNYVSYNVTEEDLTAWGLDTPELTVTVDYATVEKDEDGNETETPDTFVLHVGRNQEELAAKEAAEETAAAAEEAGEEPETDPATLSVSAYARVGDSQIVYQISTSDYNTLTAVAYDDLRHTEVLTADFAGVTQIDVTLEGKDYTVTSEIPEAPEGEDDTGEEPKREYSYDGEEIDVTNLQSKVSALTVNSFTSDDPEDKEEISLVFHLENENYPQVKVELYRCDGTNCLAVVDGETLGLVDRASVVDLIEAVNSIILG